MTHSTRTSTKLAGMLAIAAAVAMPAVAMAQTPAHPAAPAAAPMTPATPAMPAAKAPMGATTTMTKTTSTDAMSTTDGDRASKIIGASVTNEQKETVGTVEDLIITQNEKVPTAVLSVGGFLGIGTKYVEVPFSDLKVSDKNVMMAGATKDSLKALPEFKFAK
jgi:sporulation protein YlmC with PRC-barrel domain